MNRLIIAALLLLAGCAASPTFKESNPRIVRELDAKPACCKSYADLSYKKLSDYSGLATSIDGYELIIDGSSQVYSFPDVKTYVGAIELTDTPKSIWIRSVPTGAWVGQGGIMSPVVEFLNERHESLKIHSGFEYDADEHSMYQESGIQGTVAVPPGSRFMLVYTNKELLGGYTRYLWNGSRCYNAEKKNAPSAFTSQYEPSYGVQLIVEVHLPVGRIFIKTR